MLNIHWTNSVREYPPGWSVVASGRKQDQNTLACIYTHGVLVCVCSLARGRIGGISGARRRKCNIFFIKSSLCVNRRTVLTHYPYANWHTDSLSRCGFAIWLTHRENIINLLRASSHLCLPPWMHGGWGTVAWKDEGQSELCVYLGFKCCCWLSLAHSLDGFVLVCRSNSKVKSVRRGCARSNRYRIQTHTNTHCMVFNMHIYPCVAQFESIFIQCVRGILINIFVATKRRIIKHVCAGFFGVFRD